MQMFTLIQHFLFHFPQPLGSDVKLLKIYVVHHTNHIQLYFLHNKKVRTHNRRRVLGRMVIFLVSPF
jgi:hypothetical protein